MTGIDDDLDMSMRSVAEERDGETHMRVWLFDSVLA
jgi:hypothetical protein